jgi:hypothetical protein
MMSSTPLQDLINSGKPLRCRNCGDRTDAPERPCPDPSPGIPYVDCGRGGHFFDRLADPEIVTEFVLTLFVEPIHREPQPPTEDVGEALDEWLERMRTVVQAYAVTRRKREGE